MNGFRAYLTSASAAWAAGIQLLATSVTYSFSNQRKAKSSVHPVPVSMPIDAPDRVW